MRDGGKLVKCQSTVAIGTLDTWVKGSCQGWGRDCGRREGSDSQLYLLCTIVDG